MAHFVGTWLATAVAVGCAVWLVPGITAVGTSWEAAAFAALALALVNALVKPVLKALSLPITVLTLGLFGLVINALMLELASYLSLNVFGSGIQISSFWSAVIGAVIISVVASVVGGVIGVD